MYFNEFVISNTKLDKSNVLSPLTGVDPFHTR